MMVPYHGAGVLFWHEDQWSNIYLLLGRRIHEPGSGLWAFPGGPWEEEDGLHPLTRRPNYHITAVREAEKETFLHVRLDAPSSPLWKKHLPGFHWELYTANRQHALLNPHHLEFSQLCWFSLNGGIPKETAHFVKDQIRTFRAWCEARKEEDYAEKTRTETC